MPPKIIIMQEGWLHSIGFLIACFNGLNAASSCLVPGCATPVSWHTSPCNPHSLSLSPSLVKHTLPLSSHPTPPHGNCKGCCYSSSARREHGGNPRYRSGSIRAVVIANEVFFRIHMQEIGVWSQPNSLQRESR